MNRIETKYAIGDVVFTARPDEVEKEIVTAIKITGLRNRVSYSFKQRSNGFSIFGIYNDESWYDQTDLFDNLKDAEARQAKLKARQTEKEKAEEAKELIDMERQLEVDKENLRRKKAGLPLLEDYDD